MVTRSKPNPSPKNPVHPQTLSNGLTCIHGHLSTEVDFCSECGLKLEDANSPAPESNKGSEATRSVVPLHPCPQCHSDCDPNLGTFCENCGYNLALGVPNPSGPHLEALGETAESTVEATAPEAQLPEAIGRSTAIAWILEISIDPTLRDPQFSPEAPQQPSQRLPLQKTQTLLGRTHLRKAIHPDLSLDFDDAISCRHLMLMIQPHGSLQLRDLGSSNGTFLQGQPLVPMQDHPLQPGDSFTLGHWTRITVHSPGPHS